ncbi:Predicted integral membrane protein [Bacillus sp. OV194]|nr:Predicted integral membrane protein [Bacillus sp. OV194]
MFGLLLVLHILASIAIIGPAFVMPIIRRSARTVSQLRFAFGITTKLAIIPKIGGAVLIITGVWLMIITKMGLSQMWLNVSILLSLLMVVMIDGLNEPRMKKIIKIVSESQDQGNEIPAEFGLLMKKIVPIETAAQLLMIAILVLMVVKPF